MPPPPVPATLPPQVNLVTSYWKHTLKNALYPECTCPGQTTHEGRCRYVKSSVVTVNPDMMMVRRTVFQLLCALEYCHKRGILHRNIKPQRILIDGDGNVQLGGFSIARSVSYPSNYTTEVRGDRAKLLDVSLFFFNCL